MDEIRKIIQEEIKKMLLFEEGGVPDDVLIATKEIIKKLVEHEKNVDDFYWRKVENRKTKIVAKKYIGQRQFEFDDLFFENAYISFSIVKPLNKDFSRVVMDKSNYAILQRDIRFNKKNNKIENFQLDLVLCYNKNLNNKLTQVVIAHELLHLYEFYKRGSTVLSAKHDFYNSLNHLSKEKQDEKNITFLFYCLCYFELNANIVALYKELYKHRFVHDYNSALKYYYKTNVYNEFLKNLQHPEIILNEISVEDLYNLNSYIDEVLKKIEEKSGNTDNIKEYHGKLKKQIYFNDKADTLNTYIKRIGKICKQAYDVYFKRVGKIITKVVDDKNKSLLKTEDVNAFHLDAPLGYIEW